jgi:hypothetical protein
MLTMRNYIGGEMVLPASGDYLDTSIRRPATSILRYRIPTIAT